MDKLGENIEKVTVTFLDKDGLATGQRGFRYDYSVMSNLVNIKEQIFHEINPLYSHKVNLKVTKGGEHDDKITIHEENFNL